MVSDDTTQDIWVYAPDADGSWPVVYALPGADGEAQRDLDVMATELARRGFVVFATDWRTTSSVAALEYDVECGYRYSREIAAEFGGDLDQPVTMVGHSMGATGVLYHALGESQWGPDGQWDLSAYVAPDGECFAGAPRPDVLVGIAGCHTRNSFPSAVKAWGNTDAHYVFVSGSDDAVCDPAESEAATAHLRQLDYNVTLIEIPDANHGEPVFHDMDNDWETLPTDSPIGQQTVRIIIDAIDAIDAAQP
jgi:acetyl esterase/lipase